MAAFQKLENTMKCYGHIEYPFYQLSYICFEWRKLVTILTNYILASCNTKVFLESTSRYSHTMNLLDLSSTCYSTSAAVLHKTTLVLHFPNKFITTPTLSLMHKLAWILQTDYLIIVAHINWWE